MYPFRFGEPTLTQGSLCEAPAAKKPLSLQIVHLVFPYIPSSTPFCLLRTSVQLGSDQPWVSSLNWVRNKEGHAGSQTPTINNLLPQSSQATASYHCVPSCRLQSSPSEKIWPNNVRLPQDNVGSTYCYLICLDQRFTNSLLVIGIHHMEQILCLNACQD